MNQKRELNKEQKKELRKIDILVAFTVIAFVLVHAITVFAVSYETERTKADYDTISEVFEANPVVKWLSLLKGTNYMLRSLVLPGFLIASYVLFRRYVSLLRLQMIVYSIFTMAMLNVINDVTLLIANLL